MHLYWKQLECCLRLPACGKAWDLPETRTWRSYLRSTCSPWRRIWRPLMRCPHLARSLEKERRNEIRIKRKKNLKKNRGSTGKSGNEWRPKIRTKTNRLRSNIHAGIDSWPSFSICFLAVDIAAWDGLIVVVGSVNSRLVWSRETWGQDGGTR